MSYAPPSGGSLALEFIGAGYEPPHGAAVNLDFTPTVASGAPIFMSGVSGFAAGHTAIDLIHKYAYLAGFGGAGVGDAIVVNNQTVGMVGLWAGEPVAVRFGIPGFDVEVRHGSVERFVYAAAVDWASCGQPSVINRLRQVFPLMAEGMEDVGRPIVGLP